MSKEGKINPDCPQCRERVQKDACSCEDKYNSLQSKYQKLVIIFAIVSGIVGKTIIEEAMSLFESTAPVIEVSQVDPKPKKVVYNSPVYKDSVLFANVPPLLTRLEYNTEIPYLFFEEQTYIPSINSLVPLSIFFSEKEET